MSRTKDYRIVINVANAQGANDYTQVVDLKCIDTEQDIYRKASIWVESLILGENAVNNSVIYILSSIPQVRTLDSTNQYNLGNCRILETAIELGGTCYYNAYSNSHKVAVPISSLQSNFNVSISNNAVLASNTLGVGRYCLVLKVELQE